MSVPFLGRITFSLGGTIRDFITQDHKEDEHRDLFINPPTNQISYSLLATRALRRPIRSRIWNAAKDIDLVHRFAVRENDYEGNNIPYFSREGIRQGVVLMNIAADWNGAITYPAPTMLNQTYSILLSSKIHPRIEYFRNVEEINHVLDRIQDIAFLIIMGHGSAVSMSGIGHYSHLSSIHLHNLTLDASVVLFGCSIGSETYNTSFAKAFSSYLLPTQRVVASKSDIGPNSPCYLHSICFSILNPDLQKVKDQHWKRSFYNLYQRVTSRIPFEPLDVESLRRNRVLPHLAIHSGKRRVED